MRLSDGPLGAPQLGATGSNPTAVATRRASSESLGHRRPMSARPGAPVLFPPPSQCRHPHPASDLLLAPTGPRTEPAVAAAVGSAECSSRSPDLAIPCLALLSPGAVPARLRTRPKPHRICLVPLKNGSPGQLASFRPASSHPHYSSPRPRPATKTRLARLLPFA